MRFKDKKVLVTGAAQGIGRATARMFAAEGAQVALHFRTSTVQAEKTLESLDGGPHRLFQADISSPSQAIRLIGDVFDQMGRIDVLVNNVAIFEAHPIAQTGFEDWLSSWRRTIDTNLLAAANVTYLTARRMIEQGGGRVVNISSRGAFRGEPEAPAYGASKAGLNAMSQSLAQALAPHNIFVFAVAPGFVGTERVADRLEGPGGDAIRNQSPLKRVAYPEEVARTVLFLASEGTDFLTGCIVDVNGASYLR